VQSGAQFPLTPALSPRERENYRPRYDKSRHPDSARDERQSTLSPRERAGVRGNWAHALATGPGVLGLPGASPFFAVRMVMPQDVRPFQTMRQHQLLVVEQLSHRPFGDHRAAVQHDGSRTQFYDQFQVVRSN
jgi:hypothetical protein